MIENPHRQPPQFSRSFGVLIGISLVFTAVTFVAALLVSAVILKDIVAGP